MTLPVWYEKVRRVPGPSGRMWALLDHMAGINDETRAKRTGAHIVHGAAFSITSDGFAMVTFNDGRGTVHHGAFWGPWSENVRNVDGLADHLNKHGGPLDWTADDSAAMRAALLATIGIDYRPAADREPLPDGFRVRKVAKGRARATGAQHMTQRYQFQNVAGIFGVRDTETGIFWNVPSKAAGEQLAAELNAQQDTPATRKYHRYIESLGAANSRRAAAN